jgi:hypothetical protein
MRIVGLVTRDLCFVLCVLFLSTAALADPGQGPPAPVTCKKDAQWGGCTAETHQQKCDANDPNKICKGQECVCS